MNIKCLLFLLLGFIQPCWGQASSMARNGGGGNTGGFGIEVQPVYLGDYLLNGMTYFRADGKVTYTGGVEISGTNRIITIPWAKAPWDVRSKLAKQREEVIALMKKQPRLYASVEALEALWGKPIPSSEKPPSGMEKQTRVVSFTVGEFAIYAHINQNGQALMFEINNQNGWTTESTEAVLLSMTLGKWKFDNAQERWIDLENHALMVGKRLRVISGQYAMLLKDSSKNTAQGTKTSL